MNSKQKANIWIAQAIAYYTNLGYTVSVPLTDSQKYDLVVDIAGTLKRVQVKYVSGKAVDLRSISGSSRKVYYSINENCADILFVVQNKLLYEFNVKDIIGKRNITLNHIQLSRMVGRVA